MPGPLLTMASVMSCPHMAPVLPMAASPRVLASGQPVLAATDAFPIVGCPFTVGPKLQPCIRVQWLAPAARVLVDGRPAVLATSTGVCLSPEQAPQGPPLPTSVQPRALGA